MWTRWLVAFAFTQVVECPIYLVALRARDGSMARKLAIAFGASAITHPVVWFAFPAIWRAAGWFAGGMRGYWAMVVVAELFAVAVEAAYLGAFGLRPPRALAWALAANAISLALGLLSRSMLGWP